MHARGHTHARTERDRQRQTVTDSDRLTERQRQRQTDRQMHACTHAQAHARRDQVEHFGLHINVDGTVFYGIKVEAIKNRTAEKVSASLWWTFMSMYTYLSMSMSMSMSINPYVYRHDRLLSSMVVDVLCMHLLTYISLSLSVSFSPFLSLNTHPRQPTRTHALIHAQASTRSYTRRYQSTRCRACWWTCSSTPPRSLMTFSLVTNRQCSTLTLLCVHCVCVCVCMYVCMCVCVCARARASDVCMNVCMNVCMHACTQATSGRCWM